MLPNRSWTNRAKQKWPLKIIILSCSLIGSCLLEVWICCPWWLGLLCRGVIFSTGLTYYLFDNFFDTIASVIIARLVDVIDKKVHDETDVFSPWSKCDDKSQATWCRWQTKINYFCRCPVQNTNSYKLISKPYENRSFSKSCWQVNVISATEQSALFTPRQMSIENWNGFSWRTQNPELVSPLVMITCWEIQVCEQGISLRPNHTVEQRQFLGFRLFSGDETWDVLFITSCHGPLHQGNGFHSLDLFVERPWSSRPLTFSL